MTALHDCHDCGVAPGQPHVDGCDVARCRVCGWQRIGCDHCDSNVGWGQVWDGRYPGTLEVAEGLAEDLNELALMIGRGELVWNGQRWVRPVVA
jgi:hypothetical protein